MISRGRHLRSVPLMTPTAATAEAVDLVESVNGDDELYADGDFSVTGIYDDASTETSTLPSSSPVAPYPANTGRGQLNGSAVWVATRITVDGVEYTSDIGSVPNRSLCTAPRSYAVPVDGGGTSRVYLLSEFK